MTYKDGMVPVSAMKAAALDLLGKHSTPYRFSLTITNANSAPEFKFCA